LVLTTEEKMSRYAQLSFPLETELGGCEMSVREILSLAPGSLLTLDQRVGSKVTLFVGGASFCSGDMIRPGSGMALRITGFESRKSSQ
jgi:flagellar motor switch/type III secretory pathway protein FliN